MNGKIEYTDGYKYQLKSGYVYKLHFNPKVEIRSDYINLGLDGILSINSGYAWDGPSGPTYDSRNSMRASLIHDALYQLMRSGFLPLSFRKKADLELYKICREDGMWYLRAKSWYHGVRIGAAEAASPKSIKKTLTAP
jgi:hypothetical protein